MCISLNEAYLRSANRGSNNFIQIFNQNITDQPSMKRRFFWSVFFNSRTAIAEAIIGLLLVFFYFVVMIFVTTI